MQIAWIAAYATAADDCDARTLVEVVDDGWWYTSLAPGNRRVVGFLTLPHTPADFAERLAATTHVAARLRGARLLKGPRATDASSTDLALVALVLGLARDWRRGPGLRSAVFTGPVRRALHRHAGGARRLLASDVTT